MENVELKDLKKGDLVVYETVGGGIICSVVKIGPRLIVIEMGDTTRRTVSPRSVRKPLSLEV